jgi:hypothetical protein
MPSCDRALVSVLHGRRFRIAHVDAAKWLATLLWLATQKVPHCNTVHFNEVGTQTAKREVQIPQGIIIRLLVQKLSAFERPCP